VLCCCGGNTHTRKEKCSNSYGLEYTIRPCPGPGNNNMGLYVVWSNVVACELSPCDPSFFGPLQPFGMGCLAAIHNCVKLEMNKWHSISSFLL
jgi:hypothetical protein